MNQPIQDPSDLGAKLDAILLHMERLDRRDRLRTWGGLFRNLITILPVLFFLWSAWYIATHSAELIRTVADESARAAAKYTQQQSADFLKQMQDLVPKR
jgi:hypothetical protein